MDFTPLPESERFPTNVQRPDTGYWVKLDSSVSSDYLIITGFSSLEYLVSFFYRASIEPEKRYRVVLGNEPLHREGKKWEKRFGKVSLEKEIEEYWLERGISIEQSSAVIRTIHLIESGVISFRLQEGLHAKLYSGDEHVIVGSSNFSRSGLREQKEANLRLGVSSEYFSGVKEVAEYYYNLARDYSWEIKGLLKKLLQYVTWQEALARAVAELLEGKWLEKYPDLFETLSRLTIWPSQMQAVGQALYILDHHGGLLIADPTGSGKTRMGAALHLALLNRFWKSGRGGRSTAIVLCPPLVRDNWQREYYQIEYQAPKTISHGLLRHQGEDHEGTTLSIREDLKNAHILFIDEAHKFLNKNTQRSKVVSQNSADHIALFTATPINREINDLFRIIEILGVDNLPDEAIGEFEQLIRKRKSLSHTDIVGLQHHIRNFTIRRTKTELNRIIDEAPERYVNRNGDRCRFPKQICRVYALGETERDVEIMREINHYAGKLKGLVRLIQLRWKPEELTGGVTEADVLQKRLHTAAVLSKYQVQAMIRSSVPALVEHIQGTAYASKVFDLNLEEKAETGDMIGKLRDYRERLPKHNFTVPLPEWLSDLSVYQASCDEEIAVYERITNLARKLSLSREHAKAKFLLSLLSRHDLVLAFDSRLISLHYFETLIRDMRKEKGETLVITGNSLANKRRAKEIFGLDSQAKGLIGLCSDAMSEGVNLQKASAVVLLDMPSVMRIAEQRIGRIDRMDSPYSEIEIYWPEDHPEFALKTDKKFFRTAHDVKVVLGSNITIPVELLEGQQFESITGSVAKSLYEETIEANEALESRFEDGVQDAFHLVRQLVTGSTALIDRSTYERLKTVSSSVLSSVSVVKTKKSWGFFAIRGSDTYAPQWIFINEARNLYRDLPVISELLRENLREVVNLDSFDEPAARLLDEFLKSIQEQEFQTLPNRKRRALEILTGC